MRSHFRKMPVTGNKLFLPQTLIWLACSFSSLQAQQTLDSLDYLNTVEGDWKKTTNLSVDTTAPGHILTPTGNGIALHRNQTVPMPVAGVRYTIAGTYHLTHQTAFSHGFWDINGADGFGVGFFNASAAGADDIAIIANGDRTSLVRDVRNFNFDTVDLIGTAFLEYKFSITEIAKEQWNVKGDVFNDKGAILQSIDSNFKMSEFRAETYGVTISQAPLPTADLDLGANNINGLSWDVTVVPEPSSSFLLILSSAAFVLRRRR